MDLLGGLLFVIFVSAVAVIGGRTAKAVTHQIIPGKEPVTYMVIAWEIVTIILFFVRPDMFLHTIGSFEFEMDAVTTAGMLLAVAVMYPIGYHYGPLRLQYVQEFDRETIRPIATYPVVYYYNRKGQLCISLEKLWPTVKTLFGIHCTLDMPLDKIARKYRIVCRSKIIKVKAEDCVSVFRDQPEPYKIKKWIFSAKVTHHKIDIGDYNTIDHVTYLGRTSVFKEATEIATNLNNKVATIEVERTRDHIIAGGQAIRDLRELTMDNELSEEVRASLVDEKKAAEELKRQAILNKLRELGAIATVPVDAAAPAPAAEESAEADGGAQYV